jgi:hypothetical protein
MKARVREARSVPRWCALTLLLLVGCSKATSTPGMATCTSTDDELRASASASGFYGAFSASCAAGPCPSTGPWCASGALFVTSSATGAMSTIVVPQSGAYAAAVAPGTYEVCAQAIEGNSCIRVVLAPGALLRIDVSVIDSPGGDYTTVHVHSPQGAPCDLSSPEVPCDDGLACEAQAGAALDGTCQPSSVSPIGGPCDFARPVHVCGPGLNCTPVADGGLCTTQSAHGGPCDDGMHVCDLNADHCDHPSLTCVGPADAGAYCIRSSDCSALEGLDCWDSSRHRLDDGGAGTCQAPAPQGEACDQFYQCAGWSCDGGTCGPLLPSGGFCVGDYQCAAGACVNSSCSSPNAAAGP